MLVFGVFELSKTLNSFSLPPKWMVPGGLLSLCFGRLCGHQGALRSMFLLRAGLGKEAFIATGVAIACLVDFTRLPTYLAGGMLATLRTEWPLLMASALAAFAGAWWGKKLIPKVTLRGVQRTVGVLMLAIAGMLASGVV